MTRGPDSGGGHTNFAWIGHCVGDELENRVGRNGWVHLHDEGHAGNACNRRDVADEIEIKIVVERRIDRVRADDLEERIAIGRRPDDCLDGNIAAGTWPVFDNKWLAELG